MVSNAILFIADESLFVSRATSCCMRLYSYKYFSTSGGHRHQAPSCQDLAYHLEVDVHTTEHPIAMLELGLRSDRHMLHVLFQFPFDLEGYGLLTGVM